MSRRSAQYPDQDPARYPDEYRGEHSASRRAWHPTRLDHAWGRDGYPAQDSGWGQDGRPGWGQGGGPGWAQDSGWDQGERPGWDQGERPGWDQGERPGWDQGGGPGWAQGERPGWAQDSGWGQGERPGWDQGEGPGPRRAARPAWGRDEFAREPPASRRAQRLNSRQGEYPTQPDLAWDRDVQRAWDRDVQRAWDGDEQRGRDERRGWDGDVQRAWDERRGRDERRAWDGDEQRGRDERRGWDGDEQRGSRRTRYPASPPVAPQPAWRRAGHREPAQPEVSRPDGPARHRKPSLARVVLRRRFVWMTVAVVVAATAGLVVGQQTHWPDLVSQPAAVNRVTTSSGPRSDGGRRTVTRSPASPTGSRRRHDSRTIGVSDHRPARRRAAGSRAGRHKHGILASYGNPVRAINGLLPERIDMGVDFGGSGSIYAIGPGVVVTAMTGDGGWPGGGWMSYRLTSGPATGLVVYVAEDITPTVTVGQTVNSKTVIAKMFKGSAGIETGWAQSNGISPESQAPEAGAIWGQGPFPTAIAMNFEELLQALGVPAGYGRDQSTFGTLPTGYPTSW